MGVELSQGQKVNKPEPSPQAGACEQPKAEASVASSLKNLAQVIIPAAGVLVSPLSGVIGAAVQDATTSTQGAAAETKSLFSRCLDYGASLIPQGVKDVCSGAWNAVKSSCRGIGRAFAAIFGRNQSASAGGASEGSFFTSAVGGLLTGGLALAAVRRSLFETPVYSFSKEDSGAYGAAAELRDKDRKLKEVEKYIPVEARELVRNSVIIGPYGQLLTQDAVDVLVNHRSPDRLKGQSRALGELKLPGRPGSREEDPFLS